MKSGVYIITNTANGKHYIGESWNIQHRIWQHKSALRANCHDNEYLQRSVNKYGLENFKFEILEECNPEFTASFEHYWCNLLNTHNRNHGYNIKPTHPYRKNLMSIETRRKLSSKLKGRKGPNTGKKYSPEKITNLVEKWKANYKDPKYKEHIENWRSGYKRYIQTRGSVWKGRKKTSEHIAKIQFSKKKYIDSISHEIVQLDKTTSLIVKKFVSIREAARETKIDRALITRVLKGIGKTAGGYKWQYKNQING